MNRRKFLGLLGAAPLVAKAAPLLELFPPAPVQATTGAYADFVSFSELASETAIDPIVEAVALELGRREAMRIDCFIAQQFDMAAA